MVEEGSGNDGPAEEKLKRLEVRKGKGDTTEELEKEMSEAKREKEEEESEIERLQRQKRFNAEEACKVSKEKTFVGGPEEAKEPWKDMTYDQFVSEYKGAMNDYIGIDRSLDDAESFLEDHPMLLTEHALGYMLMVALDHGMHGNKKAMRRVVKNKYHVKSILDFTNETQHQPQSFVNKFFQRLRSSASMEKEYWRNFEDLLSKLEVRSFPLPSFLLLLPSHCLTPPPPGARPGEGSRRGIRHGRAGAGTLQGGAARPGWSRPRRSV